jgi:hypothetical protein
MKYYQGLFKPHNPSKYHGDPTNICYRSGWELRLFTYLDKHPDVVWWQSEETVVPYRSPIDNRIHRYYPDVIFKNTRREVVMVEIKPHASTIPPVLAEGKKPSDRSHKKKMITYVINDAKWRHARAYCADRGWKFQIMTEYDLGIKPRPQS